MHRKEMDRGVRVRLGEPNSRMERRWTMQQELN
jgi:hypothetical protein